MLRLINNLKNLSLDAIPTASNAINMNLVRWRRKPRKPIWKGTAKSKIFRVNHRIQIPIEETLEIRRLYNNYRTNVKTIKQFLTLKYNEEYQQKEDTDLKQKEFEEDLLNCMKINDEWNAKQKVMRDAKAAEELEEALKKAEQRKLDSIARIQKSRKEKHEIVLKEIECSKHYIRPEMLSAEIERALANPVDYNFALDMEGNKIYGRETVPSQVAEKEVANQSK